MGVLLAVVALFAGRCGALRCGRAALGRAGAPVVAPYARGATVCGAARGGGGPRVAEPSVAYDPSAAEALLRRAPARWLRRNFELFFPAAAFVGRVAADRALGVEVQRRPARARELGALLENLGPAIIKAGQALGSRPDLVPAEYLRELQKLQDRCQPFPTDDALRRVEESLGLENFADVFALDRGGEPVAAASIGQVYKATLVASGDVVALKVQRPDCEAIVGLDLYILRWWAGRVSAALKLAFKRDLDLVGVVDDFGRLIYAEIDYTAEARNAEAFGAAYGSEALIKVPKIYANLTTQTVLCMEWIDGERLVDGRVAINHWSRPAWDIFKPLYLAQIELVFHDS